MKRTMVNQLRDAVDPRRLFDAHGRGILLAGDALDLQYVDPGNEVRVSIELGA